MWIFPPFVPPSSLCLVPISTSTYAFSPQMGLIYVHPVDSIHLAPHQAVYDALQASLVNAFGLGERKGAGAGAACEGRNEGTSVRCKV